MWAKYKLSELGAIVGGATPSTSVEKYYGGEIAWVTPKDLSSFSGRYIECGERNITEEGLNSCSAQLLPAGSVLFSSRAPIGYVAIAKNPIATNQGFKSLVPDTKKVDSLFMYYLLKYNKNRIEAMGSGTTFKEVSGATMKNIEVNLPPLAEQKRIAAILGALDDKIELNRRINANLEEQAQALFKSWFVDFEAQNSNPGFFNDIIQTTLSGDWGQETPKGNYTSEVYCIRGADIPDIKCGDKGKLPTRFILEKNLENKKLSENDLVVEISGGSPTQSTGRICLITRALLDRLGKDVICTNFCRALKPIPDYSFFIYLYWQYLYNNNIMFSYENGTTGIKNLNITDLINKEPIIIPKKETILEFNNVLQSIFDMIYKNGRENEHLSALRDTLLPKLMAGNFSRKCCN